MAITHIFAAPMCAWGHITSLLLFSARLVQANPNIHITIATAGSYHERSAVTLKRHFTEENASLLNNIRVISLIGTGVKFFELVGPFIGQIPEFYSILYNEKEAHCNGSGKLYPALPKPKFAFVDSFGIDICQIIRSVSQRDVPVYIWQSAGGTAFIRYTGPEEYGGMGDISAKSQELSKKLGKTPREIEYEAWHPTAGEVVELPGLGKLYDYECSLQIGAGDIEAAAPMDGLHTRLYSMMRDCDGLILHTNPVLEPETTEVYRKWFKAVNKPLYAIGPLIASEPNPRQFEAQELETSIDGQKIIEFLKRVRDRHGPHSLIYMAFGTFWWPPTKAVAVFIDEALNQNIPLLVTYDESRGVIPADVLKKLNSTDNALVTEWAPQRHLLNCDTVGWFYTHCGSNSLMETLYAGTPVIACPIDGDQHTNAMYIEHIRKVGFELIEVREWIGGRPFYRGGVRRTGTEQGARDEARRVLAQAFGPEGEERRRNVRALSEKMKACWAEGGPSRADFNSLIEALH